LIGVIVRFGPQADAAGINNLNDMDRILFEPHPLAHQYSTRWNPDPAAPVLFPRLKVDPDQGFAALVGLSTQL
jgi:hypothetical protein